MTKGGAVDAALQCTHCKTNVKVVRAIIKRWGMGAGQGMNEWDGIVRPLLAQSVDRFFKFDFLTHENERPKMKVAKLKKRLPQVWLHP